ncbi:hypothetical protein NQ315_010697 [Exocentrus adspersus]|uniref:Uncharacterized protein n=1 Tax=Exocentrus adspersus TaxID=1586481 RepID=A0AAV8VTP4_9CUCU|nr:hypothetical protein NQ315_010697 [Exocentrus adspersus]
MFESPSLRLFSENSESVAQRKPGSLLARKPFLDRSVNSKTPDTAKVQKSKLNLPKGAATAEKPKVSPKLEDLNIDDYAYSFKDVEDSYEDIWPASGRLGSENLVKILRNYCNVEDTPPPSPEGAPLEIHPMFFELPKLEPPVFQLEEEPLVLVDDIEVPEFEDNEFDSSY